MLDDLSFQAVQFFEIFLSVIGPKTLTSILIVNRASIYRDLPALQGHRDLPALPGHGNDFLLLLVWSSIQSTKSLEVFRASAFVNDGKLLHQGLLPRLLQSASADELGLLLAAVLSLERLLQPDSPVAPLSSKLDHLKDLTLFLEGHHEGDARRILERTAYSFVRVVSHGDKGYGTLRILAYMIDLTRGVVQNGDGIFDEYWIHRLSSELDHSKAIDGLFNVLQQTTTSIKEIRDRTSQPSVNESLFDAEDEDDEGITKFGSWSWISEKLSAGSTEEAV